MAEEVEIFITEGATFSLGFTLSRETEEGTEPVDLTGFEIYSQIRKNFIQSSPVLREFTTDILDPTQGKFSLYLSAEDTEDVTPSLLSKTSLGFYDIFLKSPSGVVSRLVGGPVTYFQTVTRREP